MATNVKSSRTSRKSAAKSVKNAASVAGVKMSAAADVLTKENKEALNAVTAAAVAGASYHAVSVAVGAGLAAPAAVPAGRASGVASAVMDETEIKVIELRAKIAANWSAPEWSGAAALRALLASSGLSADQIEAAVSGAARKSGEDLTAVCPSVSEVCDYISANYSKEFKTLCGCSVPAASAVRVYSYSNLSVSTITADSDINDYLISTAVPSGLSASGVVSAVMSVRVLVDIKRRFAAARAAARNDFKNMMSSAARRALRLGVSPAVAARYFSMLLNAVPAADASEEKRLRNNLSRCWASLRACEVSLVMAGAVGAMDDNNGGFCFPAAGLAAVLPSGASAGVAVKCAKIRKLWAKRVRLLSDIDTLNMLLSRC